MNQPSLPINGNGICPTCRHPLTRISTGERHYWCPRCGTLKEVGSHLDDINVPKLTIIGSDLLAALHKADDAFAVLAETNNLPTGWEKLLVRPIRDAIAKAEGLA